MKFCGKYCGKYKTTEITNAGTTSKKGKAIITISEVGKGAFLININKDNGAKIINELAYLENNVLRSETAAGSGITSTYFHLGKLIHQTSSRKDSPNEWFVSNFSLKKF